MISQDTLLSFIYSIFVLCTCFRFIYNFLCCVLNPLAGFFAFVFLFYIFFASMIQEGEGSSLIPPHSWPARLHTLIRVWHGLGGGHTVFFFLLAGNLNVI